MAELIGLVAINLMISAFTCGMVVQQVKNHGEAIADHEKRLRILEPQVLSKSVGR